MQFFNITYPDPASNLAFDEAMLNAAESGAFNEALRIWESPAYFVVLGYASKWSNEVLAVACQKSSTPILRRKSGGATVLQGPGCLNFSMILPIDAGIRSDTRRVMEAHQAMLTPFRLDGTIEIEGISDLTWNRKKFSGNAMRRGKTHFLFHGTFLYQFDLERISAVLGHPDREPVYRARRSHRDFLTNLPLTQNQLAEALQKTWAATEKPGEIPLSEILSLKKDFYENEEWNLKL